MSTSSAPAATVTVFQPTTLYAAQQWFTGAVLTGTLTTIYGAWGAQAPSALTDASVFEGQITSAQTFALPIPVSGAGGLWTSVDNGATWQEQFTGTPVAPSSTTSTMTAINAPVVGPNSPISGQDYVYSSVAIGGPWSNAANVQYLQTIPTNGTGSTTGWVTPPASSVWISPDGMMAIITDLNSSVLLQHTVQMRDIGTGITSPVTNYDVVSPTSQTTVTVTFSDGSAPIVVTKPLGVTAAVSYAYL
jgi:hypothetical protein